MVLYALFLVLIKPRSCIADYFRLLDPPKLTLKYTHNEKILIECRAVHSVVTSAAEVETHGVFHHAKLAIHLRHLLIEMGNPQVLIPIKTDNLITSGFVNRNIQMKRSKAWGMKLH